VVRAVSDRGGIGRQNSLGCDRFHGAFYLAEGDDEAFAVSGVLSVAVPTFGLGGGLEPFGAWAGRGVEALWEKTLERTKLRRATAVDEG
jgi:hypothetical protein